MDIAILGGSFDPPHRGHVVIANKLLKLYHFNQIWLMPLFQHPFNKNLSSPDMRHEMTKCLKNDKVKVSDFEIRKKTISYTIDTLRFLTKKYPQDNFCWIIGTDQVDSFTKWKEWKEIIDNFKLIVVPRTGFKKAEKELENISKLVRAPKNIFLIDKKKFPPIYISSTLIRKKVRKDKSIVSMVPKKVGQYIIDHGLYL
ncbi:MAG: nicotinate (nicotinamide) nucleotide adenylyltransferase [Candidatus Levybacteria bacterium]|nr:nicotinate (nicotinamide) nucleotide adenylyltransferase [Candidatus Levybacteria bacterium]